MAPFTNALVLTGPTGSGKTPLGIELAERLGAEIVSMDSMTLYRGMDIGTAKPTLRVRKRVPHHLIDVLDPWESASVAWWLDQAANCCRDIESRGRRVLFVGGTPLYLKALLFGLFAGPGANPGIRQRLEAQARELGTQHLHQHLTQLDPVTGGRVHPNDLRRIIRALEVLEITGRPISEWQVEWERGASIEKQCSAHCAPPSSLSGNYWLDLPRAELYERINRRVEAMIAAGLVEEVRALRQLPHPLSREAGQALGYKEIIAHLEGEHTLEETVNLIQSRSRHLAKRQITWFRHLPGCQPVSRELTGLFWSPTMEEQEIGGSSKEAGNAIIATSGV